LVLQPDVLLLDEPTANLDGQMTGAVEAWLLEEIRRRSVCALWVAHDPDQIHRVADRHYRIKGPVLERVDGSD
jgi:ABC-type iron transport system FetAB ATPase subunit